MKTFISCCTCCKTYTNNPHRHSLTLLSKMFIFFLFSFFFSALTSFSLSPPHPQPQMMHSPVSHSLIVTSVNELEEGSDAKRLLERHLASIPYSTSLSFVCVCVLVCVCVCVCLFTRVRALLYTRTIVS